MADMNGTFAFRSLESGSYTVVVEGGDNFETARERVYIESDGSNTRRGVIGTPGFSRPYNVQIYLQPKNQSNLEGKTGILNAALANVPKPAAELYQKAIESVRKGESDKAVAQLKGAIEAYPTFTLALSELGVQYLKLKQPDKAAEVLQAALKLAPDDYATLLSYGFALYEKKEFGEAETQLRLALKKNNASPSAHLYLGLALIGKRELDAAEKELRQAVTSGGAQMSLAHYYLGGLYWGKRDYRRAADELETYLKLAPNAADAERLRATIKDLRSKQ
jgi:Tfp pilus assembly protein PilF